MKTGAAAARPARKASSKVSLLVKKHKPEIRVFSRTFDRSFHFSWLKGTSVVLFRPVTSLTPARAARSLSLSALHRL